MKGSVVFQFVDLLLNPISNLEYKVEDSKGRVVVSGLSDFNGKTMLIGRDFGFYLIVFVKKIDGSFKNIGGYYIYRECDIKVFRSPKVLIDKLRNFEKNKTDGNLKLNTYVIKKNDTLYDVARK